jgi:hypothetical protein
MRRRRGTKLHLLGAALLVGASLSVGAAARASSTASPSSAQIKRELVGAVHSSHARVKNISVDTRTRKLRLDVSVGDPAAYLKHRYAKVVKVVYPHLVNRFAYIYLKVFDWRSGQAVLTYSDVPGVGPGAGRQQAWRILPKYLDCARNLPLDDIEIDPDHSAVPCPAR